MRWLFAMLIAVFCWTGSVSGQQLCVASPKPTPSALSSLPLLAEPALSPYDHVYRAPAEARRKAPGKLPLLLPRAHSFSGSLLASSLPAPVYTLAAEPGYRIRFPRQDTPATTGLPRSTGCWTLPGNRVARPVGKKATCSTVAR